MVGGGGQDMEKESVREKAVHREMDRHLYPHVLLWLKTFHWAVVELVFSVLSFRILV